ncbi:MAG: hypothetical protein HKN12_10140 [Gemmatimonadetes bacterium]|nr:hypothetical protein [Gemmatimonadota bacterium]
MSLGETFEMNYAGSGKSKIPGTSRIFITDLSGNILQTLKLHTSCSEPLLEGDQFGGVMLVGCVEDNGGVGKTPKGGKGKGKK